MLYREMGHRQGVTWSLSALADVIAHQGNQQVARALYEENLAVARAIGDTWAIASCFVGLARLVASHGELVWAARLWGTAEALREGLGTPLPPVSRASYQRAVAAARTQLGEQAFATAWAEGRTMTPEQAFAAQGRTTRSAPVPAEEPSVPPLKKPTYPDGLTAREVEVLRLLAQGLTNAQIAERLVISVVTVNFHVRSIYSKLGISSRSAATRYAIEHQFV